MRNGIENMFFKILENVRARPAHQKQTIVFSVAGSITLAIFLFWLVDFRSSLETVTFPERETTESSAGFNAFVADLQEQFSTAGEDIQETFADTAIPQPQASTTAENGVIEAGEEPQDLVE